MMMHISMTEDLRKSPDKLYSIYLQIWINKTPNLPIQRRKMTSSTKNKPGTPFPPDIKYILNSLPNSHPSNMLSKEIKDK